MINRTKMSEQQQRTKKPRRAPVQVELQKAEEGVDFQSLIKTRGQLEEEEVMAAQTLMMQQAASERAKEAARYSSYFRMGLLAVIVGAVGFLGFMFKPKLNGFSIRAAPASVSQ